MSSRARRVDGLDARPFDWSSVPRSRSSVKSASIEELPRQAAASVLPTSPEAAPAIDPAQQQQRLAQIEREAFAKGYEQGERAGVEAGAKRADAMLRRLAQTLEELGELRKVMIRQTERQMVQLALAIAKRVVRREVAIDHDLTLMMARVALERLGDSTSVVIRLHPEEFAATSAREDAPWAGSHVSVVADASVSRGACLVESDFGYVDASVDAQFQEIARALLAEEGQDASLPVKRDR